MSHRSLAELVARLVAAEAARKALLSPDEHDFDVHARLMRIAEEGR